LIVKNVGSRTREQRIEAFVRDRPDRAKFFGDNATPAALRLRNLHARRRRRD
jgi:hypothetical protein